MRKTPIDASRRRELVLVGLGHAAALTLGGIEPRDDVRLVGAVDPLGREATTPVPPTVEVGRTLADLPAFDIAVVATPTATHPDVCRALFERCRGDELVLCEKPLADDPAVASRVLDAAAAAGIRFRRLLPLRVRRRGDVGTGGTGGAGAGRLGDVRVRRSVRGRPRGANRRARLELAGLGDQRPERARATRRAQAAESLPGNTAVDTHVRVTFSSGGEDGEGTIRTAWDTYARKTTAVRLVDGTDVLLDHRAATVTIDGREVFRGAADPSRTAIGSCSPRIWTTPSSCTRPIRCSNCTGSWRAARHRDERADARRRRAVAGACLGRASRRRGSSARRGSSSPL